MLVMHKSLKLCLEDIKHLMSDGYLPFAAVVRAIPWPLDVKRNENDAEHSFSLAMVSGAVASRIGLDPEKTVSFAVLHDFVEVYAGDTSVWDDKGLATKEQREAEALEKIKVDFAEFPWIADTIADYESLKSQEARLVYSLDKLLALLLIMEAKGHFWKTHKITFEMHDKRRIEVRKKIAKDDLVLSWYDEATAEVEANKSAYFYAD